MGYTTKFNGDEKPADYTDKQKKTGSGAGPGLLNPAGDNLLQDKQALRHYGYETAMNVGSVANQNAQNLRQLAPEMDSQFDTALTAGKQQVGYGLGQGLAAGSMSQGLAGHAGYGAQLQAGKEAGVAGMNLEAQVAKDRMNSKLGLTTATNDAALTGATAAAEGAQSLMKMGTDQENSRKAMQDAQAQIDAAKKEFKTWAWDDNQGYARKLRELAAQYADMPDVQAYMMKEADFAAGGGDI